MKKASSSYRRTGRKVTMHKNVNAVLAKIPHLIYLLSKLSSAVRLGRDWTSVSFENGTQTTHPNFICTCWSSGVNDKA